MASAELKPSRRERPSATRRWSRWTTGSSEFHEAQPEADGFQDLPDKWQAAIQSVRRVGHQLRVIDRDQ